MRKLKVALALSLSLGMASMCTTPAFASTLPTSTTVSSSTQSSTTSNTTNNDEGYTTVVSLGANLTYQEKEQMLKYFDISSTNAGNVKIIETTNEDIVTALGYPSNTVIPPSSQSISSCKVTLLPKGSGITVSTNNLTQVTGNMLASALETCGITNASIVADAPYAVTGQAALAGVIQSYQDMTGKKVSEQNKKVANEEIDTTTALGNQIGTENAEKIVNESKAQVIKEAPNSKTQINNIVNNVANTYNIKLTPQQEQEVSNLMQKVNGLHLNWNNVKNTMNEINNNIQAGKKDFDSAVAQLEKTGFFGKIEDFFGGLWRDICTFCEGGTNAVMNQTQSSTTTNTSESSNTTNN